MTEIKGYRELSPEERALQNITRARQRVDAARDAYERICEANIEAHCPIQIGDEVVVNTYAHRGKTMVVDEIRVGTPQYDASVSSSTLCWVAHGRILRKDGAPGQVSGCCYRVIGEES